MTAPDVPTADLLAAWDAFDLFDYADDSEGFAALVAIVEPMVERLRALAAEPTEPSRCSQCDNDVATWFTQRDGRRYCGACSLPVTPGSAPDPQGAGDGWAEAEDQRARADQAEAEVERLRAENGALRTAYRLAETALAQWEASYPDVSGSTEPPPPEPCDACEIESSGNCRAHRSRPVWQQAGPAPDPQGADEPMAFVGLIVMAPGPPAMTGDRDLDEQDRELSDIYGIESRP